MNLQKKLSLFNDCVKDMRTGNRHTVGFFFQGERFYRT